jgi:hypothetical protein
VQATVFRVDPQSGDGEVITDTGEVLPFAAAAVPAGGLRHLRIGQRLHIELDGAESGDDPGGRDPNGAGGAGGAASTGGTSRRVARLRLGTVGAPPA